MGTPKVVVVGAGPGGSSCALTLARSGAAEVLLLDKSSYPRIKVCGSGVSPTGIKALEKLDMLHHFDDVRCDISSMKFIGPEKREKVVASGAKGAWVIPRVELDNGIAREAERAGARFEEGVKVTGVLRDNRGEICGLSTNDGEIEADFVVFATGSPSRFERDKSPKTGIRTIMGWWTGAGHGEGKASMIWDRRLDGYYAWAFPEPGGVFNVGITIPDEAPDARRLKALFQDVLDEYYGLELSEAQRVRKWMGHPAVVTTKIGDVAEPRGFWIGEAARLVCPGTVEGIAFAMLSGIAAAETFQRHFEPSRGVSRLGMASYKQHLARTMLPMFWVGEAAVKLMRSAGARKYAGNFIHGPGGALFETGLKSVMGIHKRIAA